MKEMKENIWYTDIPFVCGVIIKKAKPFSNIEHMLSKNEYENKEERDWAEHCGVTGT